MRDESLDVYHTVSELQHEALLHTEKLIKLLDELDDIKISDMCIVDGMSYFNLKEKLPIDTLHTLYSDLRQLDNLDGLKVIDSEEDNNEL